MMGSRSNSATLNSAVNAAKEKQSGNEDRPAELSDIEEKMDAMDSDKYVAEFQCDWRKNVKAARHNRSATQQIALD